MAMAPTLNVMEANRRLLEYVNWTIESIASQNGAALRDLLAISPPFSYRDNIAMALDMVKVSHFFFLVKWKNLHFLFAPDSSSFFV